MPVPERWLELADEDIEMAEYALSRGIFRQVCFHAQQAAEKALKGILDFRIGTHPKSHVLEQLLLYDPGLHSELRDWQARCRDLDRFYIPTRYANALPGLLAAGEPTREQAEVALQNARELVALVREKISQGR